MKSIMLLLFGAVLLTGLVSVPSSAAEQSEAAAPASLTAPSVPPLLGPTLLSPDAQSTSVSAAAVRVGVIDMQRISTESAMGKTAQSTVKSKQQKLQKDLDARKAKLDKMQADIERQMPTLKPAQRDAKIKEFQKKVDEMQKSGRSGEKELMAIQEKLTTELLDTIEQAARDIGTASGLAAVVVKGNLLYLEKGVEAKDISAEVVTLMNAKDTQK